MSRIPHSSFLAILAALVMWDCPAAGGYPLFESDDTLELTLEVPMRTLLRAAKKKPVVDGQLHYVDTEGSRNALDISMTTRGKSRLELCSLPPLSISLKKEQTANTLFAGQKKLKIVTNCKNSSSYQRYLQQEYGIYRAYNLLTDRSFRVRMLNVTYRDLEKKRKDEVMPAFFIESDREVAERLGMMTIRMRRIKPSQLNPAETNIYELFQYMIANTDWSILKGPGSEECCHNAKVIGSADNDDNWIVLPYDFDQAGIINTKYALPASGLGIRKVRTRLYRGRCIHNDQLDETIALFNERRSELEAALTPQFLPERNRRTVIDYLDAFFEIINDSEILDEEIIAVCRGPK
jgi:hypothetical protein